MNMAARPCDMFGPCLAVRGTGYCCRTIRVHPAFQIELTERSNTDVHLVRPPRGGSQANRSSLVLDSLQTFEVCRSVVITSARSGGLSKQCRQDLIVSPTH
jgi:hypothetical protein